MVDGGQPFSVAGGLGYDNSATGVGLDLMDRVSGEPLYANGKLNYYAFTENGPGDYGNSGRNAFRLPKYVDYDMALMKNFKITERYQFQFRSEAFNLLNHPTYYSPNVAWENCTPANFDTYTAARPPRILQFSGKIIF